MTVDRRQIFKALALLFGEAAIATTLQAQSDESAPNNLAGVWLEPFVDAMPIPQVLAPNIRKSGIDRYRIRISEFRQQLHRDLPPTVLWGFNGNSPGPTIAARKNRQVQVEWLNQLPTRHRLQIDHTICGAEKGVPPVRTVIHLHGGHVAASSDGYPSDWVTSGGRQSTIYPNRQPAATLWYHDHTMGITRLNAMMGLAGFYLLTSPEEQDLGLPSAPFDIPVLLQDRMLDAHGQLIYPVSSNAEAPWISEFFGNQALVNGKIWPYLPVQPRPYRFRLLNASNSRVFRLSLSPPQRFLQVGSDGGLLPKTVLLDDLLLAPGERSDIVIDFSPHASRHITLINDSPAPYPSGNTPGPRLILQFHVAAGMRDAPQNGRVLNELASIPRIPEESSVKTRRHLLQEHMTPGSPMNRMLLNGFRFDDPITEDPQCGTVEIWEFVNATQDAHPIHLHAVHFQVLDRCPFDVVRFLKTAEVHPFGRKIGFAGGESGWKDTVLCLPGQITRIIIPFHGEPGRFVWHCHMLEHEDNEMMRPYVLRA